MVSKTLQKVLLTLLIANITAGASGTYTAHASSLPTVNSVIKASAVAASTEKGNTNSNLANGGLAVEKGNWIYYSDSVNNNLSKVTKDNKVRKVIVNESAENINLVGDWIYYTNADNNIYKVKTDGTSKTRVGNDKTAKINVVGDWIYYTIYSGYSYQNGIYKIKTDGSSKACVTSSKILSYAVENNWIYYVNKDKINVVGYDEPVGKLYKVKADGTSNSLVCDSLIDTDSSAITVEDGWIYYKSAYCPSEGAYKQYSKVADNKLYKIKVDGKSKTAIKDFKQSTLTFSNINVTGGWVYYSLLDSGYIDPSSSAGATYKIKTDGTGEKKFTNVESGKILKDINVVNDWIFGEVQSIRSYGNWGQSFTYPMKMKTDGSSFDYYDNNVCSSITGSQGNDVYYKDFFGASWKVNINSVEPSKTASAVDTAKDVVTVGDWQYYAKKDGTYQFTYPLYRKKKNGTGDMKLCDNVTQFQIVGNTIVYTKMDYPEYENHLYKMNLDGTGKTKLSNGGVDKFASENDTVYYDINTQNPDEAGIYKTSISKPAQVKLVAGHCSNFFIKGSYIFYDKYSSYPYYDNQRTFWKINKNGTSAIQLDKNVQVVDSTTINDYVFYLYGGSLYKLNVNTNKKDKIVDALAARVTKDYIFYNPKSNSSALYKVKLDGTSIVKLSNDGDIDDALVVGNWVYYRGGLPNQDPEDQSAYLWKVKLDGTSNQRAAKRDINKFYNFIKDNI